MLPKKERLSREEFNRFFLLGKRYYSPIFQIVYTRQPKLHVSVVISKKITKLAVKRNKIRRQIYDIVRNYRTEEKTNGVYIFLVKQPILEMKYDEMKQVVHTMLKSITQ